MFLGFAHPGLSRISSDLPTDHSREYISGGNSGTRQTIKRMRDLVSHGKRDFRVRKKLHEIIGHCPRKDYYCYAKAVFDFCQRDIQYVFDPNGVELIESPFAILESKVADCDSIVVLFATLCEQMGLRTQYVTIKADPSRPSDFSHVYAQVMVPGKGWVSADPTMGHPFGWTPGKGFPRKAWDASNDEPEFHGEMEGMNELGMDVPHVQRTPGVMVSPVWSWRDEPALVTTTPEQLELQPLRQEPMSAPPSQEEFFIYTPGQGLSGLDAAPTVEEKMAGVGIGTLIGVGALIWLIFSSAK